MKASLGQIANCLRTLLVLLLLLSGLQTVPLRAGLTSDFQPVRATLSSLATPPSQALSPTQGIKWRSPDQQIAAPGSEAAYDIPPPVFLPDNGIFLRDLRLLLPASRVVASAVQTGHSPRAPPPYMI